MKERHREAAEALLVQQQQQRAAADSLRALAKGVDDLRQIRSENFAVMQKLHARLDALMSEVSSESGFNTAVTDPELTAILLSAEHSAQTQTPRFPRIDLLESLDEADWRSYMASVRRYAQRNGLDLTGDPFSQLMTDAQRIAIEKRIDEELTYKPNCCDKYDYMIAAACGLLAGLIDIVCLGMPGQGFLGKVTDEAVANAVKKFASLCGWKGPRGEADELSSAVRFLENKFPVNYDHRYSADIGRMISMNPKNHHIKSLAHSPDLVGLVFGIIAQFTGRAYFVDEGIPLVIQTEAMELQGGNVVEKLFAAFVNWFGHLASDVAGSSTTRQRGSGIPAPFYSLLQFINVGSLGSERLTISELSVKLFEEGYDFRHLPAMAIPVTIAELLTRFMWSMKARFYHGKPWKDCIPSSHNPELRRMLLVAHGVLCMVDSADAALRSGGELVNFLLRANAVAWVRLATLALRELTAWYHTGQVDPDKVNEYLEAEYARIVAQ